MLEEKLEKEKLQRSRVERLLETRERERILNDERRTQYEARCAAMEEAARERARRKQEELEKASQERERIKKVISDQFAEAAQRNLERDEAAATQAKVFMEIAAEEQQRLAKVRGEIATEKTKEQYKSSARGIRDEQNRRRVQIRKEAARRAREEAALHRRTHEKLERESLAAEMDTAAAPTAFNRCLHSDKHIMECQCCQPPASWGITKSISLAWGISDMALKNRPVKVMPLQEVSVASANNTRSASKLSAAAAAAKKKKSHQGDTRTRQMMRADKRRAKQKLRKGEPRGTGMVGHYAPGNDAECTKAPRGIAVDRTFTCSGRPATQEQNSATTCTRSLMKRDKLRAKRRKNHNRACGGTIINTQLEIFVDNEAEHSTKIISPTMIPNKQFDTSSDVIASQPEKDILDEVVQELMALDSIHDPELERLMTERRELMANQHYYS
jgi:hypothetical protein